MGADRMNQSYCVPALYQDALANGHLLSAYMQNKPVVKIKTEQQSLRDPDLVQDRVI